MFGISKQLLIAIGLGALAMMLNQYYLTTQAALFDPGRKVQVVLAKKDLSEGTMLTTSLMERKAIPERYVPKGSIKDPKEVEGQELGVKVQSGDYILWNDIPGRRIVGRRLSDQVDPKDGTRAITIPVDELNSLSRSLTNGDRVDILYTFNVPGLNQKLSTVLLQNVQIINTGSYSVAEQERGESGAGKKYGSVTLKLAAQDALRLNYARQNGQISVLLRNSQDNGALDIKPITSIEDVLSPTEKTALQAMSQRVQMSPDSMDKLREQFKGILEAQKKQNGK
jgi:pilus assembly protein CpaB